MLEPRLAVRRIAAYRPPVARRIGLRLDFNENTAGCSPRVLDAMRHLTAEQLSKYPERAPVESLVAQHLGLAPSQVLLTNGVDEAIHLLAEAYLSPGDEAVMVAPTFAMYEIYAQACDAGIVRVAAGPDFRFPSEGVLEAITPRTRLMMIASPNNPTGVVARRQDLLRIAEAAPHAAVLVDEAYFEFCGNTLLDAAGRWPNLFVARTFSKAYGLAGLRAGVLAGEESQMSALRRIASPYNVNNVALACLPAALADREFVADYVRQVRLGRARLEAELKRLGIRYWPSEANFVLAYFGDAHRQFVSAMRAQGILVRSRDSDPGCAGCVRITVGAGEHNRRLLEALPEAMASISAPGATA